MHSFRMFGLFFFKNCFTLDEKNDLDLVSKSLQGMKIETEAVEEETDEDEDSFLVITSSGQTSDNR